MSEHTAAILPTAGQVAYFVHLHQDTARDEGPHPVRQGERVYRVDGKSRPMLIVAELARDRGRRWFRVLRITSKGLDENGDPKADHEFIGNCIFPDVDSFVVLELQRVPANLLQPVDGCSAVVNPCDRLGFHAAWKVLQHKLQRFGIGGRRRVD